MKITHASGETYDLNPETKLEFTRTNPFFSDIGEQTFPISLPSTPKNMRLLGNPHLPENKNKINARINANIQSGLFSLRARQAVLSARRNEDIQTSFYINNGALYEQANNLTLTEIFADKTVDFATVDAAVAFVRSLMITPDHRFACFQVATENYIINEFGPAESDGYASLVKKNATTEIIDDKQIAVPKGFYISPFIKVKHLLQEVLDFMGYALAPSSFLDNEPFSSMVFLNDTLDTIADAQIRYIDIVPNISVSTLFEVLRKFNIEIIPEEKNKTIRLTHFDEMIDAPANISLTGSVNGYPNVNYHNNYRQLILSSEQMNLPELIKPFSYKSRWGTFSILDTHQPQDAFIEVTSRYPGAYIFAPTGDIMVQSFRGENEFTQKVGSLSFSYAAESDLTSEQKKFPDIIPPMLFDKTGLTPYPYAGSGKFLHSGMEFSDSTGTGEVDDTELKPMLCFNYRDTVRKMDIGTVSNFRHDGQKLWEYSLHWNGEYGLFEKFWRKRDKLLRNALLTIDFDLLLSENDKFNIRAIDKISINNHNYLISELKYCPEEKNIQTCRFLSLNLQEPVSEAKQATSYFINQVYKWQVKSERNFTISPPQQTREEIKYKTTPITIFPKPPTTAQYNAGGRYYQQSHNVEYGYVEIRTGAYTKVGDGVITTYLQPILNN